MGTFISNILEMLTGIVKALPYLCILALLYIILCLYKRLSSPNPFSRVVGKTAYTVTTAFGLGYSIIIKNYKTYDPKLLHKAICEMFYLYPKLYRNPSDAKLYIQDNSEYLHDISFFAESPFAHLNFSALPIRYNDEFYICFPHAETLSVPPHSRSLCFERYENKRLRILELRCPAPIPAYTDIRESNGPITVSKDFKVRVPAMQISIYQSSEIWKRLNFCTEDGTSVPLRFEALR